MIRCLRPVIAAFAFVEASSMPLDGSRTLIVGDYVTPPGHQLGPWSAVVSPSAFSRDRR
jgi:hypothetical protein